jgi:hypothetical protein
VPSLRLPSAVLEIVAGIVLGPSVLGWVRVDVPLQVLSLIGLALLLFLAGLEIDVDRLRGSLLGLVTLGFVASFAVALAVGWALSASGLVSSPLLLAIILTATSLGVVVPVLKDAGLTGKLLWFVKSLRRLWRGEDPVNLPSDVALQAPYDFQLAHPLLGPPLHVGAGAWIPAQPADHDRIQRVVRGPVATTAQAVPTGRTSGVHRQRRNAAQVGERRLADQPVRVVTGGDQQLSSNIGADPQKRYQSGCGLGHHDLKRLVELGDLLAKQLIAVGDTAQRSLGRCDGVGELWTGTQSSGRHHQLLARQRPQGSSQRFGGADHQAAELVAGGRACLHRPPPGHPQSPDGLHAPIAALGGPGRRAGQRCPRSCLGVDGIGLALATPGASVWPVDLNDGHACLAQVSQQSSAVGAGALHADPLEPTQALQPGQQRTVARGRGRETAVAEHTADRVECRSDVEVAVGVNPADDLWALGCHGVQLSLCARGQVWHATAKQADKTVTRPEAKLL